MILETILLASLAAQSPGLGLPRASSTTPVTENMRTLETLEGMVIRVISGDQSTPSAPKQVLWDYSESSILFGGVDKFYVNIDSAPQSAQVTVSESRVPASIGTFKFDLPALTPGKHKVAVQACNPDLCSDPAVGEISVPFGKPSPVTNVRGGGF